MPRSDNWTLIDVPEIETLPKAVFLRSQNLAAREAFPPHTHRWNQFVYATSGTLVVTDAHGNVSEWRVNLRVTFLVE